MAAPDYGTALSNMATGAAAPSPTLSNDNMQTIANAQKEQDQRIDILTSSLKPQAETFNGQMVLQDMLANQAAPAEQRAAAAQALNPGLKAQVSSDGTLAFSAAPGADLGFKYPDQTRKTSLQNTGGAFGRANDAQKSFDDTYQAILNMSDTNEITNAYASLVGSTTSWVENKRKNLSNSLGASMGLTQLEQQMEADKVVDQQYYNTYMNGQNLGPTDESMRTIGLYQQKKAEVDREVARQLGADPQLTSMQIRMEQLKVLVDQKTKEGFSDKIQTREAQAALIPVEQVDKALVALGTDPTTATKEQKDQLAIKIPTQPYYHTAMTVGNMDPTSLAVTAASDGSDAGVMANRVLKSQFAERPEDLNTLLTNYRNFDSPGGLGATLSDAQKQSLKIPPTATGTELKDIKRQQAAIKMSMVIMDLQDKRAAAFAQSIETWAIPQDPLLQEIPNVIKDIKAVNRNAPITVDQVAARLDWKSGGQAKINAFATYVNSQANAMPNNAFFGAPVQYSNPQLSKQWVQTIAVRSQTEAVPGYDMFSPYSGY